MTKERKKTTVAKPLFDEEAALRFAAGATANAAQDGEIAGGLISVTITLKRDVYVSLEREAAKKERTVEEHLRKFLTKHFA
jgi:hypothetical protein